MNWFQIFNIWKGFQAVYWLQFIYTCMLWYTCVCLSAHTYTHTQSEFLQCASHLYIVLYVQFYWPSLYIWEQWLRGIETYSRSFRQRNDLQTIIAWFWGLWIFITEWLEIFIFSTNIIHWWNNSPKSHHW